MRKQAIKPRAPVQKETQQAGVQKKKKKQGERQREKANLEN